MVCDPWQSCAPPRAGHERVPDAVLAASPVVRVGHVVALQRGNMHEKRLPEIVSQFVGHEPDMINERNDIAGRSVEDDGSREIPVDLDAVVNRRFSRASAGDRSTTTSIEARCAGPSKPPGISLRISSNDEEYVIEKTVSIVVVPREVKSVAVDSVQQLDSQVAIIRLDPGGIGTRDDVKRGRNRILLRRPTN